MRRKTSFNPSALRINPEQAPAWKAGARRGANACMAKIDAVVLCGGRGMRLRSVVRDRPKPMAEVNGRPFLDIVIGHAAKYGLKRYILCAGHKAGVIANYYRARGRGRSVVVSTEAGPLGTAGAIKNAERAITSDPFLVMNGDSYCPADLGAFLRFHAKKKATASMVLVRSRDRAGYGAVVLDGDRRVTRFEEKARTGKGIVNAGVYLFERAVLAAIPRSREYSLERDLLPSLAAEGRMYGFLAKCSMIDIGTPEGLDAARTRLRTRSGLRRPHRSRQERNADSVDRV